MQRQLTLKFLAALTLASDSIILITDYRAAPAVSSGSKTNTANVTEKECRNGKIERIVQYIEIY